jgi:cyclic pyranopterin phosphate synthase
MHMIDVGAKASTTREARAEALFHAKPATLRRLRDGDIKKGDALAVARLAGIMAAKQTATLVPLCHPVPLSHVAVDIVLQARTVRIEVTTRTVGQTGVEMEALCAASAAALALYDMVKGVDRDASFTVRLLEKHGGVSGDYQRRTDGRNTESKASRRMPTTRTRARRS